MFPNMKILSYAIASPKAKYTIPIALQVREREIITDFRPGGKKAPQYPPFQHSNCRLSNIKTTDHNKWLANCLI